MSGTAPKGSEKPLPKKQQAIVEEHLPLRSPMVYEIVRQEGEIELRRPLASLWWSGVAAGIAMFASVLAEGVLRHHLPDATWRPLVESFGYGLGFLIVVLGRLQLFTENTVTAVLPLLSEWSRARLGHTARLWGVVLAANFAGTFITAALVSWAGLFHAMHVDAMLELSREFAAHPPLEALMLGIPAGFLVAAIVWVSPSAEGSKVSIVVWMTWLIAVGGFTHVVVGSAEMALLLFAGEVGVVQALAVLGPTLAGNIIGGTGLFALLAYAQIKGEI